MTHQRHVSVPLVDDDGPPRTPAWMDLARCRGMDPAIFVDIGRSRAGLPLYHPQSFSTCARVRGVRRLPHARPRTLRAGRVGRHHRRRTATDPTIQGDDMNPYKVEMFLDKANQWRWRIRRSGKVLVSSEAYSRRGGCRRTAARVAAALNVTVEVEE